MTERRAKVRFLERGVDSQRGPRSSVHRLGEDLKRCGPVSGRSLHITSRSWEQRNGRCDTGAFATASGPDLQATQDPIAGAASLVAAAAGGWQVGTAAESASAVLVPSLRRAALVVAQCLKHRSLVVRGMEGRAMPLHELGAGVALLQWRGKRQYGRTFPVSQLLGIAAWRRVGLGARRGSTRRAGVVIK
ncbi:hypothetical protein AK812_SmicGene22446 [Symbiodinium microadriaticum]|uniref:Uncharacterized protein n=1 Tax=Symbiodinium microadriaticum TaxID=2951 RepID=A0A1Q9DJV2_SYMMI|nr:hypothetical protein AK812_SmicGene22446 [Symbiodinium microadriaticum]